MIPAGFARVTRHEPCRVCGRPDWCLRGVEDPDRALCSRVESPVRWRCGWLHGSKGRVRNDRTVTFGTAPAFADWERRARELYTRMEERCDTRASLVSQLGVSAASLRALRVGLLADGISAWPMCDHLLRVVGFRLRFDADGTKRAVKGSRNGLFVPTVEPQELVVVCEGESDTAAALTLGFFAIGRPGCTGGTAILTRWLERHGGHDVAIVADGDEPGIRGAAELAATIAALARTVRVVVGPRDWKDLRQAFRSGYTRTDLLGDVEAGLRVRPVIRTRGRPRDAFTFARRVELELLGSRA